MTTITLKGREIPLLYTVYEMKTIQEEICPLGDFSYAILGANKDDPADRSGFGGPDHLMAVAKLIRVLGNAGREEAGEMPDLTDKKVLRAMRPGQIMDAVNACMDAMNEGMASEIPEQEIDETVDVVLEEDSEMLEGTVVTALGIRKDEKKLGYAVSTVNSESLMATASPTLGTALYGKAAGVRVSSVRM